jgi:cell wall-associated NlpC family hydrolase
MRIRVKSVSVAVFCSLALCTASAQTSQNQSRKTLTRDDGRAVVDVAIHSKVRRDSAHDCSHLVHAIYERAGFPYIYASSDDLYDGVEGFRLVKKPQPGDIIVWHGHAGIVVQPSRHVFFSFLSAGPGTDDYHSHYWIGRGQPRFYRYIKNDPCAGCTVAALRRAP